jgi:hypothetical protein
MAECNRIYSGCGFGIIKVVLGRGALMAVLACVLCVPAFALPDAPGGYYEDRRMGFSMEYPPDMFVPRTVREEGIAFALEAREGSYPTFTISIEPGPYKPSSFHGHETRVLEEYRSVGFTDARVIDSFVYKHRGTKLSSPQLVLLFTKNNKLLRSHLVFISTPDRHFVLTYIDEAVRDEDRVAEDLFEGFAVKKIRVPSMIARSQERFDEADSGGTARARVSRPPEEDSLDYSDEDEEPDYRARARRFEFPGEDLPPALKLIGALGLGVGAIAVSRLRNAPPKA